MKKKTIWITAGSIAAVLVIGGVAVAVADPFDDDDRLSGSALEQASAAALDEVGDGRVTDAERSDDLGHAYEVEVTLDNGQEVDVLLDEDFAVVASEAGSTGASSTAPSSSPEPGATDQPVDADDQPISDEERASASEAALAETGGGSVTDVDRSDDLDHAWSVEVTLDDGTDVDVELDADFAVTRVDTN